MSPQTLITASPDITYAELEGEALVLHVATGQYYGLNKLGLDILELAKESVTYETLFSELLERYEVPAEQLGADLEQFLQDLEKRSLVKIDDAR